MKLAPWGVARSLFGSRSSGSDLLDKLTTWRSVLGLATLVVVNIGVRAPDDVLYEEGADKAWTNTLLGFCAVPVAIAGTYFLTRPDRRGDFEFRPILRRLAALVLTIAVPMVTLFLIGFFPDPEAWFAGGSPVKYAVVLAMIWFGVYFFCVAYWAGRTYCWVGEFHPLLGPAVTSAMVVGLTAITLLGADTKGLTPDVWLVLQLGGLVSTLVLAAWEYRLIRRDGVGWRTGPRSPAGELHQPRLFGGQ